MIEIRRAKALLAAGDSVGAEQCGLVMSIGERRVGCYLRDVRLSRQIDVRQANHASRPGPCGFVAISLATNVKSRTFDSHAELATWTISHSVTGRLNGCAQKSQLRDEDKPYPAATAV